MFSLKTIYLWPHDGPPTLPYTMLRALLWLYLVLRAYTPDY